MQRRRPHEKEAYILDYLRDGNPLDKHKQHRNRPLLQLLGVDYFILMEGIPLVANNDYAVEQKIPLDENSTVKIDAVIVYDDLTAFAKDTLNRVIKRIIEERERVFVEFFNKAEPLTLKLHALELLHNIGKKTLRIILEERKKRPFTSFKDIEERVGIKGIEEIIEERILTEMKGQEKYYLFVYPPETVKEQVVYVGYMERLKV